mgnify:CR=1 FL=1
MRLPFRIVRHAIGRWHAIRGLIESTPSRPCIHRAGRLRVRALIGGLALAGTLSACSPEFNWRELRSPDQGFIVQLPGRPATMTRSIDLNGVKVDMTMVGARVDQALFTVGSVELETADASLRERSLAAMRIAMLRNIGAEPVPGAPARVGLVDIAGASRGAIDAITVSASGQVAGAPVLLQALFAARGNRLWQAVAIVSPAQELQARTMLDSFQVLVP